MTFKKWHHFLKKKILLMPKGTLLREDLPMMFQFMYFMHIYLFVKPYRHYMTFLLQQSRYAEI